MENRRIDSWKEIATYLKKDVRTVIRWEKERGLPVHRVPGGRKNAVFAFTASLDSWLMADVSPPDARLLAVLPFDNGSGDAGLDYLCDGLTESLINRLAQSPQLRVLARSTVFRYRGPGRDVRAVGRALGVPIVLSGVVRQEHEDITVSAELVGTRTGQQMWGSRYVQPAPEVWALGPRIVGAIADELQLQLSPTDRERLTQASTRNPEAMRQYWRGRQSFQQFTPDGFQEAIGCFQRALSLDPRYARAHAALAEVYGFLALGYSAERPSLEMAQLAEKSAREALSSDPGLAEGHAALALSIAHKYDLGQVESHLRRAIELQPSNALARSFYAYTRLCRGILDDAIVQADRAVEIDPAAVMIQVDSAAILAYAGDLPRARELMDRLRQAFVPPGAAMPGWMYVVGLIHQLEGNYGEAIDVLERATAVDIMHTLPLGILGHCYARAGNPAKANEILDRLAGLAPERHAVQFSRAVVLAGLNQDGQALDALERGYAEKNPWLYLLKIAPWFDAIRGQPRYRTLVERLQL